MRAVCEPMARGPKGRHGPGHGGPIAGLTLLIPLVVWGKTKRRIGRGEAYRAIQKMAGSGASKRMLQANWMKYRRAAHVWAAASFLGDLLFKGERLGEFIAAAQQIRTDAGAYIPQHDRDALLPLNVSKDLDWLAPRDTVQTLLIPQWAEHVELHPDLNKLLGLN